MRTMNAINSYKKGTITYFSYVADWKAQKNLIIFCVLLNDDNIVFEMSIDPSKDLEKFYKLVTGASNINDLFYKKVRIIFKEGTRKVIRIAHEIEDYNIDVSQAIQDI